MTIMNEDTVVGIRVEFTPEMRDNATENILQKKLNRSITDGESMPLAAGGEEVAKKIFKLLGYSVVHDNSFEHDMTLNHNETIEVKTKDRTTENVVGLYNASVATSNCTQRAEKIAFVSLHRPKNSPKYDLKSYTHGILVAVTNSRLFKELSYFGFLKEMEPKSSPTFWFKNTCLNQRFMNINSFRPDGGYFDFDETKARERSLNDIKCSFGLIGDFKRPIYEMNKAISDLRRFDVEPESYLVEKFLREQKRLEQTREAYLNKHGS